VGVRDPGHPGPFATGRATPRHRRVDPAGRGTRTDSGGLPGPVVALPGDARGRERRGEPESAGAGARPQRARRFRSPPPCRRPLRPPLQRGGARGLRPGDRPRTLGLGARGCPASSRADAVSTAALHRGSTGFRIAAAHGRAPHPTRPRPGSRRAGVERRARAGEDRRELERESGHARAAAGRTRARASTTPR